MQNLNIWDEVDLDAVISDDNAASIDVQRVDESTADRWKSFRNGVDDLYLNPPCGETEPNHTITYGGDSRGPTWYQYQTYRDADPVAHTLLPTKNSKSCLKVIQLKREHRGFEFYDGLAILPAPGLSAIKQV